MCARVVDTVVGGGALLMPSPVVAEDDVVEVLNGLRDPGCCAGSVDADVVAGCGIEPSGAVEDWLGVCC